MKVCKAAQSYPLCVVMDLQGPVKYFAFWGLRLNQNIGNDQPLCIYPEPFCAMRIINDARYSENDVGRPIAEEIGANDPLFC